MSLRIRVLAGIWLALALAGAAYALWLLAAIQFGPQGYGGDASMARAIGQVYAIAILVIWTCPLLVVSGPILLRRRWSLYLLIVYAVGSTLIWSLLSVAAGPQVIRVVQNRILHGPYWGGFPEQPLMWLGSIAIAALSVFSIYAAVRELRPPAPLGGPLEPLGGPIDQAAAAAGYAPVVARPAISPETRRRALKVAGGVVGLIFLVLFTRTWWANSTYWAAARDGNRWYMQQALDRGASVNCRNGQGLTPLMDAARRGDAETARLLLDRGANVHARDPRGNTALMYVSRDTRIANMLMDAGVDELARNNDGMSAAMLARTRGDEGVVAAVYYHVRGGRYGW